jgi:hypothetical protein
LGFDLGPNGGGDGLSKIALPAALVGSHGSGDQAVIEEVLGKEGIGGKIGFDSGIYAIVETDVPLEKIAVRFESVFGAIEKAAVDGFGIAGIEIDGRTIVCEIAGKEAVLEKVVAEEGVKCASVGAAGVATELAAIVASRAINLIDCATQGGLIGQEGTVEEARTGI